MPVVSEALLIFIINGPITWGPWNGETVLTDWPYCRGKIRVLNTMLGFCREAFHVGQTEMIFLLTPYRPTAKVIDVREPCSGFHKLRAHVPQHT
jgi:hypothetical protein